MSYGYRREDRARTEPLPAAGNPVVKSTALRAYPGWTVRKYRDGTLDATHTDGALTRGVETWAEVIAEVREMARGDEPLAPAEERAEQRDERRAAREEPTPFEQGQKLVERLTELTGVKWTFGYIGNLERWGDDRAWYAFAEHPGRVGTRRDSIGGQRTEQIDELIVQLRGAVQLAVVLKEAR